MPCVLFVAATQQTNMELALLSNIEKLYDNGLYECVIPVASLLSSLLQNDRLLATLEMEYQTMLYLSSANYKQRNFRVACNQLESVLMLRKKMQRFKGSRLSAIEVSYKQFQDVELRYRVAVCYREMGDYNMAISTLLGAKSRTPRINMMLARLLHQHGRGNTKETTANAFKDVLRECPMSLTAIKALIELGTDGSEVHSMVVNADAMPDNIEWLSSWIKAHAQMYGCKHLEAAKTFQHLNDKTSFHQNEHLLTNIGKCFYYYGNFTQAERYLTMAVLINPHNLDAVCPLAVVYDLNKAKKTQDQEKLLTRMGIENTNEYTTAHWFLLAQLAFMNSKYERAQTFTDRALAMDARNVEALLLRGKLFMGMGRHKDAIEVYRATQCIAPYRFEVYKGLLSCYMPLRRFKDAQIMCVQAVRYFPSTPRSYILFGGTLFHSSNPDARRSAKKYVEKALQLDENYTPGIALLAAIYQFEDAPQNAIDLLRKHVSKYPHPKIFAMLAELLSNEKDMDGALHFYNLALGMDPTLRRALDGINALTKVARRANRKASDSSSSTKTGSNTNVSTDTPCGTPNHEWQLDCMEGSNEALELTSPAQLQEDAVSDAFSDVGWQEDGGA